jgi:hypothetical protein
LALARGVSVTALVRRYKLGPDSIYRHRNKHLPATVRAKLLCGPDVEIDLDKLKESESQSLLANLVALRHRLFAALDTAEEYNDGREAESWRGWASRRNLELTGKLLGDLGVGSTTNVNVLVLPAYVELRVALVQALASFPEARQAVAAVLHGLESKAADAIKADTRDLAKWRLI